MPPRSAIPNWVWSVENPDQDGAAGDITRLFKANRIEQPGVLGRNPPPEVAALFAREAIQNSWDAARELRNQDPKVDVDQFVLDIEFREFSEDRKDEMCSVLGLKDLAARVLAACSESGDARQKLGLFDEDCLGTLEDPDVPLSVMYMRERGAVGMYGNWRNSESRMMYALTRVGYTEKAAGAGGSFGYGKAGLVQASRIRVVFAYTCFQEQAKEPGVTRRLMGVTFWGKHSVDGRHYTGWVRYGDPTDHSVRPLENDDADRVAIALGFECRSPEQPEQLGTSFLVVDPDIEPVELGRAIERSWWPAIKEDDGLRVRITAADGKVEPCKAPIHDPDLGPFIKAYEWAKDNKENSNPEALGVSIGGYNPHRAEHNFGCLGRLGLVADTEGWSYPPHEIVDGSDADREVTHKSIVALVRGPRMVVQYWTPPSGGAPYVRGVFLADGAIDDLLRMTEPPNHDKWDKDVTGAGIDPVAGKVAGTVLAKIKNRLNTFRRTFAPPPPPPGQVHLPILDDLMKILTGGKVKPPQGKRSLTIHYSRGPEPDFADDHTVAVAGEALIGLSDHDEHDAAEVEITFSLAYVEDARAGDLCEMKVCAPSGFSPIDAPGFRYRFRGNLKKGERVAFPFESARYSSDWTTRVVIAGDVVIL